jgi:disulfide bond formation protein DsbB
MLKPPVETRDPVRALGLARLVALAVPAVLLIGAYVSQYVFGLYPCEMCWWQRYPHMAAVLLAALAFTAPAAAGRARALTALAAAAVAVSGTIGVFHAGVEYGWWQGLTRCTGGASTLEEIMKMPLIRCDQAQWTLAGISLAGFNAIFSLAGAGVVVVLLTKGRRA